MEIVALHVRITDLLFYSLQFLEEYDCETVGMSLLKHSAVVILMERQGDPQTAFSYLGDVVLFVQCTLAKYKVGAPILCLWMFILFYFWVSLKIKI
jgi:mediator of RNA polymerase II transcription subunit 5